MVGWAVGLWECTEVVWFCAGDDTRGDSVTTVWARIQRGQKKSLIMHRATNTRKLPFNSCDPSTNKTLYKYITVNKHHFHWMATTHNENLCSLQRINRELQHHAKVKVLQRNTYSTKQAPYDTQGECLSRLHSTVYDVTKTGTQLSYPCMVWLLLGTCIALTKNWSINRSTRNWHASSTRCRQLFRTATYFSRMPFKMRFGEGAQMTKHKEVCENSQRGQMNE